MNDSLFPCDSHVEDISLLAAGCLTDAEERDLRSHLTACDGCRARFDEMALVCSALRASRIKFEPTVDRVVDVSSTDLSVPPSCAVRLIREPSACERVPVDRGLRVAVLVATLLVMFVTTSRLLRQPGGWDSIPTSKQVVATSSGVNRNQQATSLESLNQERSQPTWMALHRAAAESDESLDRLLARYSESPTSDLPVSRTLWSSEVGL